MRSLTLLCIVLVVIISVAAPAAAAEVKDKANNREAPSGVPAPLDQRPQCCVGIRGDVDNDGSYWPDVGDVTQLISYLLIELEAATPVCMEEANMDGDPDCIVDICDLSILIGCLFFPPYPTPDSCW